MLTALNKNESGIENNNTSENRSSENYEGPHDRPDRDNSSRDNNNLKETNTDKSSSLIDRATNKQDKNIEAKDLEKEQNRLEKKLDDLKKEIDKKLSEIAEKIKQFGERALPAACEQMEKLAGNLPKSEMKNILNGANKMCEHFIDRINDTSSLPEIDKFHHCMGNCEAAEFGPGGAAVAEALGNLWEKINNDADSPFDLKANKYGRDLGLKNYADRQMGLNGTRCYDGCSAYRRSLDR